MAQITWRNVDAPNFSGALDGIRTFSSLLGRSTDSLSNALSGFQAADQQNQGNQIMSRALQINDPASYNRALSDGSLLGGVDLSRVSPDTLSSLGSRQGALSRQAAQMLDVEQGQFNLNTQRDNANRLSGADSAIRAYNDAVASGNPERVRQAQAGLQSSGLTGSQLMDITSTGQGMQSAALGNINSSYTQDRRMGSDASQDEAAQIMEAVRRNSVSERDYQQNLSNAYGSASPQAQRILGQQLGYGQGTTSNYAPSAPGTAGTRNGSSYDATFGYRPTERPITQMTMGEVQNLQSGMIADQGSSPVGSYQITKATLAEYAQRAFGDNWRNQAFTPKVQDRLAKEIYDARKGGDLTKTFAGLSGITPGNNAPGFYKDIPFEEVRDEIVRTETHLDNPTASSVIPATENQAYATTGSLNVRNRNSQENINSLANNMDAAVRDTRSPAQLIRDVTAKDGVFEGVDRSWLSQQIEQAQEFGRASGVPVPPAVALAAIEQSVGPGRTTRTGRGWDAVGSFFTNTPVQNDPNTNLGVNPDRVREIIQQEYAQGRSEERVAAADYRTSMAEQIQQAGAAAQEASAELLQAELLGRTNPAIAQRIPELRNRVANLQARQASLTSQLEEQELAATRAPREIVSNANVTTGTGMSGIRERAQEVRRRANEPELDFNQPLSSDIFRWMN